MGSNHFVEPSFNLTLHVPRAARTRATRNDQNKNVRPSVHGGSLAVIVHPLPESWRQRRRSDNPSQNNLPRSRRPRRHIYCFTFLFFRMECLNLHSEKDVWKSKDSIDNSSCFFNTARHSKDSVDILKNLIKQKHFLRNL